MEVVVQELAAKDAEACAKLQELEQGIDQRLKDEEKLRQDQILLQKEKDALSLDKSDAEKSILHLSHFYKNV